MSTFFQLKGDALKEYLHRLVQEYPPLDNYEDYGINEEEAVRRLELLVEESAAQQQPPASSGALSSSSSKVVQQGLEEPIPYTRAGIDTLLKRLDSVEPQAPVTNRHSAPPSSLPTRARSDPSVAVSSTPCASSARSLASPRKMDERTRNTSNGQSLAIMRPRAKTAPDVPTSNQALAITETQKQRSLALSGAQYRKKSWLENLPREVERAVEQNLPGQVDFDFSGNFTPGGFGLRVRSQSQSIRYDPRSGQTYGRYATETLEKDTMGGVQIHKDDAEIEGDEIQVNEAMNALQLQASQ